MTPPLPTSDFRLPTSDLPPVSVVMPVRNESSFIRRSLAAVLAQDYPADKLEVIVVDGSSSDGTPNQVRALQGSHGNLKLLDNPRQIVAPGFNAGVRAASGSIIVRVDGHTIIEPDYVRRCVEKLDESGADNVGGRMTAVSNTAFGRSVAAATSTRFGVGGALFHYSDREIWVDTVYLGAWRRETFDRIGLFDEELVRNQDDEFNYRLRAAGGKVLLSPAIRSVYYNRSTLRSLWRQYFQYGCWKVRVMQKYPRQMRPRQFAPPLLVLGLVATACWAAWSTGGKLALATVAGSYLLANLSASLIASRKVGLRYLPLLALAFATLHLAYGSGVLVGLARFWNRWGEARASGHGASTASGTGRPL